MKKLKAYTLMEMLVVMTIMIILLGVGFSAYTSFAETTKFNQDVANLQSDILIMQRASMLLERDQDENWVYGLGIDLGDIGEGKYSYFKWCSEFTNFGAPKTRSQYPAYVEGDTDPNNGIIPLTYTVSSDGMCPSGVGIVNSSLMKLSGYGNGTFNIDTITLSENPMNQNRIRFILFESVSGRTFFYDNGGNRVDNLDLDITFHKTYGPDRTLVIKNLTGRTKIVEDVQ